MVSREEENKAKSLDDYLVAILDVVVHSALFFRFLFCGYIFEKNAFKTKFVELGALFYFCFVQNFIEECFLFFFFRF